MLRKLWHIGAGLLGLMIYFKCNMEPQLMASILFLLAMFGLMLDVARLRMPKLNMIVVNIMKPFMRRSEKDSISGFPFYALGVSISLFLFPEKIAILSIFYLIFSDPISSLVGVLYGRDKILPNKSLQGTLAGFMTCCLITLIYGMSISVAQFNLIAFSLLAGLIGCLSELLSSFKIDDNLTIPVFSGLGIYCLNHIFNVL